MGKFALRRIIAICPTILLILSLLFILTKLIPGDPVLFTMQARNQFVVESNRSASKKSYNQMARNLGLDKPLFYFSIVPSNVPKDQFDLALTERKYAKSLIQEFGHPSLVIALINNMVLYLETPDESPGASRIRQILEDYPKDLMSSLAGIEGQLGDSISLSNPILSAIIHGMRKILESEEHSLSYLPKLIWHGHQNQFHHWVKNALTLDLGVSLVNGQPVWPKVASALRWTLVINILAILLAYFIAIILGVYSAWWGGLFDGISSLLLYVIYAIPIFWMATILVVFFTTSEYGSWTDIFPSVGIWDASISDTFLETLFKNAGLLVIPILVLSTSLMAFITRIVRNSILEEKNKSYVTYARTKGLPEKSILWRHIFRNASFPLITLFASVFPAAIAGSLVVEVICNIPGTGRLLYDSIFDQDWPVVVGVVLISSVLTMIGLLVSDLLYRWADPRVKFERA